MKFDGDQGACWILLNPWEFSGMGGKDGDEVWVLGAQFLQNYYTIYDFKQKKIGFIESVSSILPDKNLEGVAHEQEKSH